MKPDLPVMADGFVYFAEPCIKPHLYADRDRRHMLTAEQYAALVEAKEDDARAVLRHYAREAGLDPDKMEYLRDGGGYMWCEINGERAETRIFTARVDVRGEPGWREAMEAHQRKMIHDVEENQS